MNKGKNDKNSAEGRYHPLAMRSIRLSQMACVGYLLALATAILSIPPFYIYFPFTITAAMILLNMVGLGIAVYGMLRHKLWIDFSIALLYNAIPLIIIAIITNYPFQQAH